MKKTSLIFISIFSLLPIITHAKSEKSVPLESIDFIKIIKASKDSIKEERMIVKDGNDKDVEVKLNLMVLEEDTQNFTEKLENSDLRLSIYEIILRTKSSLKNPYSFIPREIKILNDNKSESKIYVEVQYTAENSYGANVVRKTVAVVNKNKIETMYSRN